MIHERRRLLVLGATAAAIVVGLAAPAAASATALSYSLTGHSQANFAPGNPDKLYILDRNEDGHSSMVLVRPDSISSNSIEYWNYHGAGSVAEASLYLAPGRVVYIKACEGEWRGNVGSSQVLTSTCDTQWRKGVA